MGGNIQGYKEPLMKLAKEAQQDIHALHNNADRWVSITLRLLDRPIDEEGKPVGPGPFEEASHIEKAQ